jgi:hypothetical protein
MRPRIYIDTSVIGGCEDEEFREHSTRLMARFRRGDAVLVLSDLTVRELDVAPLAVQAVLHGVPSGHIEVLALTAEADALARVYIAEGVVGAGMLIDAQHIAVASVAKVDILVSWNFKHIVNLQRIHGYNAVNLRQGYSLLEIRSPREVLGDE